jgi:uncharacterized membrane protein YccC
MQSAQLQIWVKRLGLTRMSLIVSARTAVAAVVALVLARSLSMPEFYWAPISTIVILLSTVNPLTLAWQRFVGTALGAFLGALIATYFHSNWIVYFRVWTSEFDTAPWFGLSLRGDLADHRPGDHT